MNEYEKRTAKKSEAFEQKLITNPNDLPEGADIYQVAYGIPTNRPYSVSDFNRVMAKYGFPVSLKNNRITACITQAKREVEKADPKGKLYWYDFSTGDEDIAKVGIARLEELAGTDDDIEAALDNVFTINLETGDCQAKYQSVLSDVFIETFEKFARQEEVPPSRITHALRNAIDFMAGVPLASGFCNAKGVYWVPTSMHFALLDFAKAVRELGGMAIRFPLSYAHDEQAKSDATRNIFEGKFQAIKSLADKIEEILGGDKNVKPATLKNIQLDIQTEMVHMDQFKAILGGAEDRITELAKKVSDAAGELEQRRIEAGDSDIFRASAKNLNAVTALRKAMKIEIEEEEEDEEDDDLHIASYYAGATESDDYDDDDDYELDEL